MICGIRSITYARTVVFGEEYNAPEIKEMVETAFVTAISTGVLNAPSNIADGTKVNGMSVNEAKVVDKVYKDIIAEAEQDGKKLTNKEKSKIYDGVLDELKKGEISTDTIEEVLGVKNQKASTNIGLTEAESRLLNTPDAQLTPEQRAEKQSISERLQNIENNAQNPDLPNTQTQSLDGNATPQNSNIEVLTVRKKNKQRRHTTAKEQAFIKRIAKH